MRCHERLAKHDLDQGWIGCELNRLPQRGYRLGGFSALQQHLPFELVEIWIIRLRVDEPIYLRKRCPRVGEAVGGNGAGIACSETAVARWIAAGHRFRALEIAIKLGAHQVMSRLQ